MEFSQYVGIEEVIIRNLTGSAGKKDLQILNEWRSRSPQNEASYNLLQQTWESKTPEPLSSDYLKQERNIWEAGHRQDIKHPSGQPSPVYKIAAVLMVLCVVSWAALSIVPDEEADPVSEEQVYTYNPTGQKSKITLPDHSVIYLNSESSLSYNKRFSDSIRLIRLDGEAYFEVEPDANRPFVVETGGISTVALGTSFNVRNYPEECSIQVSLLSGQVKVTDSQASNEVLLKPFEQVKFSKESRSLKMTRFENDLITTWKDGVIIFKASPFDKVIRTLERSYDVTFDTAGYTGTKWSYTGKFDNMSLEIVLTRIGYSEGFKFDIDGRYIKLSDDP
jgi:ferric-dicitrate binding protein FerR (iron transport regulator)